MLLKRGTALDSINILEIQNNSNNLRGAFSQFLKTKNFLIFQFQIFEEL